MSQAVLAYTLPNGAQVLIPALDGKNEYLPLVLLDDITADPLLEANNAANILLSGMQVTSDDLDNVMDVACSSETSDIQDNLETNNFDNSFPRNLKYLDKQDAFNGAIVVNPELGEFVTMHKTRNNVRNCDVDVALKNCDIKVEPEANDQIYNVQESDLGQSKNLASASCNTDEIEEPDTLQTVLETCEAVENAVKCTASTQLELDMTYENGDCDQRGIIDNDNCDRSVINDNGTHSTMKLNTDEKMASEVNRNYLDVRDRSATELVHLSETIVHTADSVLKEVCDSVAQCLDNEGLKSRELATCSNIILDHLDEFAEMVTWFKCRLCKFAAGNKQELLEHLQTEHLEGSCDAHCLPEGVNRHIPRDIVSEKLVFLCGQCSAGFNSINACKTHMMKVHELIVQESEDLGGSRKPETADMGTSTVKDQVQVPSVNKKEYYIRQKLPAVSASIKCSVHGCQSKFSEEKDLQIHINCHTDTENCRDFRCCECQTHFERWRSCAMHLWKVHNIDCGLLTCPICLKYKTSASVPLENHMRIHGEDRSFTCPECGKGFKQAAQLHNHRVMHLDRNTSEMPRWYASKQCNICLKNYANSKCLKKHIQAVHSKLRPYVCQVCGHASARKAMLQLHYRQHTGEKPHTCPLCDYRTGDHNSLRRHIMRHTGQRPYRCPHCPYSAIQSNSYKNHLRNKHPGEAGVFACGQCSFKTVSHEGYMLHVSDHKNGIISSSSDGNGSDVEVFPGNVAAAQLIYRCLNVLSDGAAVEANVTGSSTSADGTMQTITIQIPNQECTSENEDEVARCFLEVQQQLDEENMDANCINISEMSDQNALCEIGT